MAEDDRDEEGEEDGQEGGVGHQQDAHRADEEVHHLALAVEELPLNKDSDDSDGEGQEATGDDCEAAVADGEGLTEEGPLDGQEPLQLEHHQGQQVGDLHKEADTLVEADLARGALALQAISQDVVSISKDCSYQEDHVGHHHTEVVCLQDMARPKIDCFFFFYESIKF